MLLHAFGLREDQMRGYYSGKIKEEVSVLSAPCMVNIMIYSVFCVLHIGM